MAKYESKKGIVSKPDYELYMSFVDMRNILALIPEDKKEGIYADFDTISGKVQGFDIGVKITERVPYSRISFEDCGAPFHFKVDLYFIPTGIANKTEFRIEVEADLNLMMKAMLGPKIKDGLNKAVDAMVDMSEGRMPEGFDPSKYGFNA